MQVQEGGDWSGRVFNLPADTGGSERVRVCVGERKVRE